MQQLETRRQEGGWFHNLTWMSGKWIIGIFLLLLIIPHSSPAQKIIVAPDPLVYMYDDPDMQDSFDAIVDSIQTLRMYEEYRDYYYYPKKYEFDKEMLLREQYLLGLYKGLSVELKKRPGSYSLAQSLNAMSDLDTANAQNPFIFHIRQLSFADSFLVQSEQERASYNSRLVHAEALKAELVTLGTDEQIKRMFRYDMDFAVTAYSNDDYDLALLWFNHILAVFPYSQMDDIMFYRAESEYGAFYFLSAIASYIRLLDQYPDTDFTMDVYSRLFYLYPLYNQFYAHKSLWNTFTEQDTLLDDVLAMHDTRYLMQEELNGRMIEDTGDTVLVTNVEISKAQKDTLTLQIERVNNRLRRLEAMDAYNPELLYNAGMGLYLGGYYGLALDPLIALPDSFPNRDKAAFMIGDIYMKTGNYHYAIKPLMQVAETKIWDDDPAYQLIDEAAVLLGYAFYGVDDFEFSYDVFESISDTSEVYQDALLGMAWCEYRQNHYGSVDSIASTILEKFGESDAFFEAQALTGFSNEMLGDRQVALQEYQNIVDMLERFSVIHPYVTERRLIEKRLQDAREYEPYVIESGAPELFKEYRKTIDQLKMLHNRAMFAETSQLSKQFQEYLMEQDTLSSIEVEYDSLSQFVDPDDANQYILSKRYGRLGKKLKELSNRLALGMANEAYQTNALQNQEAVRFRSGLLDSLRGRLTSEISYINTLLKDFPSEKEFADDGAHRYTWLKAGMGEDELTRERQRKENDLAVLSEEQFVAVQSDIEDWREYAYKRSSVVELDYDYLKDQMDLLQNLTDHINQLQQVVERKIEDAESQETEAQAITESLEGEVLPDSLLMDESTGMPMMEEGGFDTMTAPDSLNMPVMEEEPLQMEEGGMESENMEQSPADSLNNGQ
ncbi:hypothetical protein K8I28_15805 [bacterium]|nr:hypothetical protein [bacterium]